MTQGGGASDQPTEVEAAGRLLRLAAMIAGATLAACVLLTSVTVILRFGFNVSLAWAQEAGRYLFVWSVYAGVFLAVIKNTHIRVTVIIDLAPPAVRRAAATFIKLVAIASFLFVAWYGALLALDNVDREFYTVPFLTLIWFYASVPIALTASALYLLGDLVGMVGRPNPGPEAG